MVHFCRLQCNSWWGVGAGVARARGAEIPNDLHTQAMLGNHFFAKNKFHAWGFDVFWMHEAGQVYRKWV